MNLKNSISKRVKSCISWISVIIVALVFSLFIQSEVLAKVTVDQNSMQYTLQPKDQIIIDKISYQFHEPEYGDIVVFLSNDQKGSLPNEMARNIELFMNKFLKSEEIKEKNEMYVKRVIGLPGDVIDIKDNVVYVNGSALTEDYVKGKTNEKIIEMPVTVGENQLFVMGDNREVSEDSRSFGPISYEQLEGKVILRAYPFNKLGTLK